MNTKNTDDLSQELMNSPNLDEFLSENRENFNTEEARDLLLSIFERNEITKAELAKHASISEVYLHQIFSGKRRPSRNRLLCLCYGLHATIEETQELLKLFGAAPLYPRNCRDVIIIYGIVHETGLLEINDKLFFENEETLF
ncbi:MAG: helix-turn-helix domain-containing protein [Oscillospiraceae bacterium]|nr:helix-turn-helix domain-containing protein [Oscillospiraceae bacterium]